MATKKRTKAKAKVVTNRKGSKSTSWLQSKATTVVVVAVVAIMGVVTLVLTQAASASGKITGIASKCLDNYANRVQKQNPIILYTCNGTQAQDWTLPGDGTIRLTRDKNYCLDVQWGGRTIGTPVQLWTCNGTGAQQWKVYSDGRIVNPQSTLCLDDRYANTSDGNKIWMWTCNGTAAQKWKAPTTIVVQPTDPTPTNPTPTPPGTGGGTTQPQPTPTPTPSGNGPRGMSLYQDTRLANDGRPAAISGQPYAIWLGDWTTNMTSYVNGIVTTAKSQNKVPVFTMFNIPHRDSCATYSTGGAANVGAYNDWVNAVANGIGAREAIIVLEPDALAGLDCLNATERNDRITAMSNAVNTLTAKTKAYVYVDAGNVGWIPSGEMANRLKSVGVTKARGFALNTSNFFIVSDNVKYGNAVSGAIGTGQSYVIDTSRNGQGVYVNAGDNEAWCNPPGRGLGVKPTTSTGQNLVDAYLWVKTPGESDGACKGGPAAGQWFQSYAQGLIDRANYTVR